MASRGLTRRDLGKYLGSRARVSEVLNRKRAITMEMIRNLHRGMGITERCVTFRFGPLKRVSRESKFLEFRFPIPCCGALK